MYGLEEDEDVYWLSGDLGYCYDEVMIEENVEELSIEF